MQRPRVLFASICLAACGALAAGAAGARDLTIVDYGGASGESLLNGFYKPYQEATGKRIIQVAYNGEQAKIKAMVEVGDVTWDLVDVEPADLGRGCDEGYFEDIDWRTVVNDPNDMLPGTFKRCGIGIMSWSVGLAFDKNKLDKAPANWADFWDVKQWPGKRGMRKAAAVNLEFALMADGVAPADVYKVLATPQGQDRAFAKLDELKPHIQWWVSGQQPVQMLSSGDVVMSTANNGRIDAAQKEGLSLDLVWNESALNLDYWVVPKGSPNMYQAIDFVRRSLDPEIQAGFARLIRNGPVSRKSMDLLSPEILAATPNSPVTSTNVVLSDVDFWAAHGDALESRFMSWVAQ